MKRSVVRFFDRFHLFSLGTSFLCGLILVSCSGEQGNWTAAQQEDRYIYGVWQSAAAKKAEQADAGDGRKHKECVRVG